MRWLFVTGIAFDIAGAVLVLGAILRARAKEVADEAVTVTGYNSALARARAEEKRYAISGGALLVLGFTLQLAGYAWTSSSWWLVVYGAAVSAVSGWLALKATSRFGSSFYERVDELMRKAVE